MVNDSRKDPDLEGTSVDLGDDLLEKTAVWTRQLRPELESRASGGLSESTSDPAVPKRPSEDARQKQDKDPNKDPHDQLHSARILINEGLYEEAKKVLRQVRVRHPEELRARDMLEEIHAIELKQIFGEDHAPRARRRNTVAEIDPDEVLAGLDRDLQLRLEEDNRPLSPLFDDEKFIREYADRLDRELVGLGARDRIDLGIAFLEMNLFEVAIRQFQAAHRAFLQDPAGHARDLLVCAGLIAHATIAAGRAFEATMQIQSVLRDSDVSLEDKLDFIYLMGRAYEQLAKPEVAAQWYVEVRKIDPHYRDAARRLKSVEEAASRSGGGAGPG